MQIYNNSHIEGIIFLIQQPSPLSKSATSKMQAVIKQSSKQLSNQEAIKLNRD